MTAYNETCAAIAEVYFNQRMFMLHGDAKYIDVLERTLYNGLISGMSVDGGRFFYPNPLASDGRYKFNSDGTTTRQPWFGCACCPSNLSRFIPSIPGYMYAVKGRDVYVNLYGSNTATILVEGKPVTLQMTTGYPWNGNISIKILDNKAGQFNLKLRIPGWARGEVVPSDLYRYTNKMPESYAVTINGLDYKHDEHKPDKGYLTLYGSNATAAKWNRKGSTIELRLDMPVRTVQADNRVEADRGRVAVERGPIVYCAEAADNDGADVRHAFMSDKQPFEVVTDYKIRNTEADGREFAVTAIKAKGQLAGTASDGTITLTDRPLTLIPYYAWNHRGAGYMTVWLMDGLGSMDR